LKTLKPYELRHCKSVSDRTTDGILFRSAVVDLSGFTTADLNRMLSVVLSNTDLQCLSSYGLKAFKLRTRFKPKGLITVDLPLDSATRQQSRMYVS
jgi:hypothetical protein